MFGMLKSSIFALYTLFRQMITKTGARNDMQTIKIFGPENQNILDKIFDYRCTATCYFFVNMYINSTAPMPMQS